MSSIFDGMLSFVRYYVLSLFITGTIWMGLAWTVAKMFDETIAWGAIWVVFIHVMSETAAKAAARQVTR